jgi:hypothetical protein
VMRSPTNATSTRWNSPGLVITSVVPSCRRTPPARSRRGSWTPAG